MVTVFQLTSISLSLSVSLSLRHDGYSAWRSSQWSSTSNSVAFCPSSRWSLDGAGAGRGHYSKTKRTITLKRTVLPPIHSASQCDTRPRTPHNVSHTHRCKPSVLPQCNSGHRSLFPWVCVCVCVLSTHARIDKLSRSESRFAVRDFFFHDA